MKKVLSTMYDIIKSKLSSDSHSNPLKCRRLESGEDGRPKGLTSVKQNPVSVKPFSVCRTLLYKYHFIVNSFMRAYGVD